MTRITSHWLLAGGVCLCLCSPAQCATLPFGQVIAGSIISAAQSNSYTFTANANDVVDFTIAVTSGNLGPKINLYSPTGQLVSYNYNGNPFGCSSGSTLEMNNVSLAAAGTYTVIIADCGDTNTGAYLISAQRVNNPSGSAPMPFGQVLTGSINSATQSNSYIFSANAKDVVDFTVVVGSGKISPKIDLFTPTGALLSYNYNGNPFGCSAGTTLEMNTVTLPTTGTYVVLVADCSDTNTGGYSIFAQRTNNPAGPANLQFGGQPQTGTISSVAQSSAYTFGATAKDVVDFTVAVSSGKLSPKIDLFSPSGALLSYNYNGNPFACAGGGTLEMNNVTLPATGTYTVLITDCTDTNTGNYNLSAQCFGVCMGPAPPPATCDFTLAPLNQLIPATAGTGNIGVLTEAGCPWTASTNGSFLTIASGSSGTGPGTVQFSATANTGAASRSGTLSIGGQTATITQTGSAPLLLLSPTSISVQWRQQSPLPTAIPLSVYTTASELNFTAAASSSGNWLAVSPASGGAPATVIVTVNPAALQPGSYQGSVTVTAPTANPSSQAFTVSLTVLAAGSPTLSVSVKTLTYAFAQGAPAQQQRILISNSGGGTLSYQTSATTDSGGNWLTVTQDGAGATASAPDPLTVNVDPGGLAVGTYTGRIIVNADTTQTIGVVVTVSASQPAILLSQTGLTFTAVVNGGIVPPQSFGILNSGTGLMDWSVSSSTISGGSGWLSVTPNAGNTDASSLTVPLITASVNPANLAPGQYSGQIQVTSTTANNSPQFVSVILNVLPAGSNPGPLVLPTGLIFTQAVGGAPAGPQAISVSNLTGAAETFATGKLTNDGANWFSVTPGTGTAAPTQATTLMVSVSSAGLTPAIRQGVLTLLFQDGSVRTVNVLYLLANGGVSSNSISGPRPLAAGGSCAPTKLLPLVTSLGSQFTVPAAWPNTLGVQVVDDCGNPDVSGTVIASFSNGDPPLPLISLKNGNWTGTWQVRNSNAPLIAVTVTADNATLGLSGSISVSGSLQSSANAPVIEAGGVVNAASYSASAPLSPGTMIAIFGSNLTNGTASASTLPLPSQLSGTLVTIGGQPAPLIYAGGGQVNAVIPYGLPVNAQTQVIVRQGNAYTSPEPIVLSAANPAIFTESANGNGQGVIIRPDGNYAQPGTPANAGDEIVIYSAGLGATSPGATAGVAATASPLETVEAPVSLTIGGQSARVDFAGLVPGFTGLYQVNAAIPSGVHGDTLPVVLTAGGQPSPAVTMAVQ